MILLLCFGFIMKAEASPAAVDLYQLDNAHSSITFTIRHMVVSKVRGLFNDFSVTVKEDTGDFLKSSVTAVIKTDSIDTMNEKRDNHLKGSDFFDVKKYPDITFKSKAIKKKGDNYIISGTLTMHGVSRDIEIPFEVLGKMTDPEGNTRMGIEGLAALDRKDFGLNWNRTLDKGGLVLGNEVKIEILLELIKKK
jgi:polyisoprenoid-binding protein YceI